MYKCVRIAIFLSIACWLPWVTDSLLLFITYGGLPRHFTGLEIGRGVFFANVLIIEAAPLSLGWSRPCTASWWQPSHRLPSISPWWAGGGPAKGAYTGSERPILLCVVNPTEIAQVRRLVLSFDPQAFVVITATSEVWGEGFTPI